MTIETKPYDAAKYLTSVEDQVELLNDAFATCHAGYIAAAVGAVARARGMTRVAAEAGLSRQSLHRALSEDGNPTLSTLVEVLKSVGLQLAARAREAEPA